MKICIVSPYIYSYFNPKYGPIPGGAQRQQFLITKQLVNRGHDVSFVVGDFGQPYKSSINGVTLVKGAPTDVDGPLSMGNSAARLIRAMMSVDPDVFLVRGSPMLTTATYYCTRILRKPLVFRLANDSDINFEYLKSRYPAPFRRLYQRAVQGATVVMAQTAQQQEVMKREFGVNSRVVTNAYDLPPESEIRPHTEREGVLWVGSADPKQKKPERFLQLATELANIQFKMVVKPVIGDDGYHAQLQENAENISNLEFLGEIDPDSIHEYYKRSKLLVNTSDYEGFPNTFLEAWRYETPVLSLFFDLDGILESKQVGIVAGDMNTLIEEINTLEQDDGSRSKMGSSARDLVGERFSLNVVASQYEDTFQTCVLE